MLRKLAVCASVAFAVTAGYNAYAARVNSVWYAYYDDNGSYVGEGYLGCYGLLQVWGQKTNNVVVITEQPCHQDHW